MKQAATWGVGPWGVASWVTGADSRVGLILILVASPKEGGEREGREDGGARGARAEEGVAREEEVTAREEEVTARGEEKGIGEKGEEDDDEEEERKEEGRADAWRAARGRAEEGAEGGKAGLAAP